MANNDRKTQMQQYIDGAFPAEGATDSVALAAKFFKAEEKYIRSLYNGQQECRSRMIHAHMQNWLKKQRAQEEAGAA